MGKLGMEVTIEVVRYTARGWRPPTSGASGPPPVLDAGVKRADRGLRVLHLPQISGISALY